MGIQSRSRSLEVQCSGLQACHASNIPRFSTGLERRNRVFCSFFGAFLPVFCPRRALSTRRLAGSRWIVFRINPLPRLFGFAGIWSEWKGDGESLKTAAIITTEANDVAREVHNRMPVILPREALSAWLDPKTSAEELKAMLVPYPAEEMEAVAVSKMVNSPKNDAPELLNSA